MRLPDVSCIAPRSPGVATGCSLPDVHAPVNQPTPVILVAYLARCRVHSARIVNASQLIDPPPPPELPPPPPEPPPLPPPEPLLSANSAPTFVSAVTRIS